MTRYTFFYPLIVAFNAVEHPRNGLLNSNVYARVSADLSCRNSQPGAVIRAGVRVSAVPHKLLDVSDARQHLVSHRHHLLVARERAGGFDGTAAPLGLRLHLVLLICVQRVKGQTLSWNPPTDIMGFYKAPPHVRVIHYTFRLHRILFFIIIPFGVFKHA